MNRNQSSRSSTTITQTRLTLSIAGLIGALSAAAPAAHAAELDRPPRHDEVEYRPRHGETVATNPPAFVWLPVEGVERWIVEYARDEQFNNGATVRAADLDMTVHVPAETIDPGDWYWRYGYEGDQGEVFSEARPFSVPEDAVDFPFPSIEQLVDAIPQTRPRAYYSPEDVDEIHSNPDEYDWLVDPIVRAAERVIDRNEPLFEEPKPWDEYEDSRQVYIDTWRAMRPYTSGMVTCAHAYLLTGEQRFADEAKRRLMHFMTWDVDGPSSVYWPTELGMDIAANAPRTFDWIYDTLSEQEREKCLEVLGRRIRQINEMHRGRPFESRPFSSHPGRMIGFAIEGGIILAHDVDDAPDWLEYTLRVLWSVYPAWGDTDGGWHEGISYWRSYITRMTHIVVELDRLGVPLKRKPFFQNTGTFGLYAAYPDRPTRSFGDGYSRAVGRSDANLMYTLASLYDNPYYRWYAEQMGGGPSGPIAYHIHRLDLEARPPADLPQSKAFRDVGWVALHSDMAEPDDNILVLFKSSPLGAISHDHANQNALVIEAFREPLAISSGYYQEYGSPHHSEWVWQTHAHNAILVDGEGQTPRSAASRGRIVEHVETGDWAYTLGDAVEAYGGRLERAYRHVMLVRPNVVIVVDDLAAAEDPATYQWLLHAQKEMKLDEDAGRVNVEHEEARMQVHFLTPSGLELSQRTGWDPQPRRPEQAPPQFHLTASTREPAQSARFVTVLTPYRESEGAELPAASLLEAEGGVALKVNDDVVLIKDPDADQVTAAGYTTSEPAALVRNDNGRVGSPTK